MTITILEKQRCNHGLIRNYRRRRKGDISYVNVIISPTIRLSVTMICFMASLAHAFIPLLATRNDFTWYIDDYPGSSLSAYKPPRSLIAPRRQSASAAFATKEEGGYEKTSASQPDDEEWKAMLSAFQMYKAAYGNLKVPLRFVVPALAPWPENAWGLKLGQRVAAIRSTGKFVKNERRRKILDDMGFVWRLRAASSAKEKDVKGISFDQIYGALVTYREHVQKGESPLRIPNNFIVPDCDPWPQNVRGLPLGRKLASIRSKSFLAANPGAKEKLSAIGFTMDGKVAANDARFQIVYDALKCYKEIYGDLLVPQPFVVPEKSKDWPEQTWGLRLGARVNAIRSQGTFVNANAERKELLDDLGFAWSPTKAERGNRRGRRRKEEKEAMEARAKAMEELHESEVEEEPSNSNAGDSMLESLFGDSFDFDEGSIPGFEGIEGDSPTWGFEGGQRLEDAALLAEEEAQAAEEYKPPKNLAESLEEAAQRAVDVGVIEVKRPDEKRFRKGKRDKNIPWFNDDFGDEFVFDDVVEALSIYRSIYGDFSNLTDDTFIVPMTADEFSDFADVGNGIRSEDASSRAAAAIASFEERSSSTPDAIDSPHEMEGFHTENNKDRVMTAESVIATVSPDDWPEHLGGLALGNIVDRIRDGSLEVKHLPERKARLDELDFDWGDPRYFIDIPFEKAMCAMYAYYLVRGDMFVYRDFVMPDEDPWPKALAGFEIGEAVHRIRELQNFFEAYHPDKVSLLRMIDFAWFPTLALPLDPNEAEMTPEMQLLSALGHPDYAKMLAVDMPMGLPEKIIADGPFFETDDPKLWWRKWHNWDCVQEVWYKRGRRDNAFVLRGMGYHQMADEHEAKYGPGLFTLVNETMLDLEENGIEGRAADELATLQEKLIFYRQELTDCTDIPSQDLELLLEDLDAYIFSLTTGNEVSAESVGVDDGEVEYEETEIDEGDDYEYEEEEEEIEEDDEDIEEDDELDFDVEDELGLTSSAK